MGLPKHRWIDRRINQLIALNGMHPADASVKRSASGKANMQKPKQVILPSYMQLPLYQEYI